MNGTNVPIPDIPVSSRTKAQLPATVPRVVVSLPLPARREDEDDWQSAASYQNEAKQYPQHLCEPSICVLGSNYNQLPELRFGVRVHTDTARMNATQHLYRVPVYSVAKGNAAPCVLHCWGDVRIDKTFYEEPAQGDQGDLFFMPSTITGRHAVVVCWDPWFNIQSYFQPNKSENGTYTDPPHPPPATCSLHNIITPYTLPNPGPTCRMGGPIQRVGHPGLCTWV